MSLKRIDIFLVEKGLAKTRTLAQTFLKNNWVFVNNKVINKPAFLIDDNQNNNIQVLHQNQYVSRGGDKLASADKFFQIDFNQKVVLDIGASTGGFSDYALQHGALKVFCLDVGYGQLDPKLIKNPNVINLEKTNLKQIPNINFHCKIDIILCDVSFISLTHVFNAIDDLVIKDNPILLFLMKPQFENYGLNLKNFKGKVNQLDQDKVLDKIKADALQKGYKLIRCVASEIKGKKLENQEYFGIFKKCP